MDDKAIAPAVTMLRSTLRTPILAITGYQILAGVSSHSYPVQIPTSPHLYPALQCKSQSTPTRSTRAPGFPEIFQYITLVQVQHPRMYAMTISAGCTTSPRVSLAVGIYSILVDLIASEEYPELILHRLSLTCRVLRPLCQRHIFADIKLDYRHAIAS